MLRSLQHPHTQRWKVEGHSFPQNREELPVWVPVNRTRLDDLKDLWPFWHSEGEGWAGMKDQ